MQREREIETGRQTDRETERERETEKVRQEGKKEKRGREELYVLYNTKRKEIEWKHIEPGMA